MASAVQSEKVLARKLVSAALKALSEEQMARQSAREGPAQAAAAPRAHGRRHFCAAVSHAPTTPCRAVSSSPRGGAPAGQAICERIVAADLFAQSRRVGVYVSCPRLREVDTSRVLSHIFSSAHPPGPARAPASSAPGALRSRALSRGVAARAGVFAGES